MKKRVGLAIGAALLFLGAEARAWRPSGWVWFESPYAYDFQESRWYYMNPADTLYCYNFASGTWSRVGQNAFTSGWSYFQCPYAYALTAGNWFYLDPQAALYCYSYNTGEWSLLGSDWEPGRHIGPIFVGNSYAVVKSKLGNATELRRTGEAGDYTLWTDYDPLHLSMSYDDVNGDGVLNDNEQVGMIFGNNYFNSSPQWSYMGLTFGSTKDAARALLGLESTLSSGDLLVWPNRGVNLFFDVGGYELLNMAVYQAH